MTGEFTTFVSSGKRQKGTVPTGNSRAACLMAGRSGGNHQEAGKAMALGALIGAYQEDDVGGLRALLPLAGRTLIEYQARCLAAAGAAPLIVLGGRGSV